MSTLYRDAAFADARSPRLRLGVSVLVSEGRIAWIRPSSHEERLPPGLSVEARDGDELLAAALPSSTTAPTSSSSTWTGGPADFSLVHGDPHTDPTAMWRIWRVA